MLRVQSVLDRGQLELLWKVILVVGFRQAPTFASEYQKRILCALRSRLKGVESEAKIRDEEYSIGDEPDIRDLVFVLQSTMLSRTSSTFPHLIPWAVSATPSAHFEGSQDFAWKNLCLMALASMQPLTGARIRVGLLEAGGKNKMADWQVLCTLVALDGMFNGFVGVKQPRKVLDRVIAVLERVWYSWVQPRDLQPSRPIAVDRAIAAAIIRMAGVVCDHSLLMSCRQYAISHSFWDYKSSHLLPVEYAVTSISCGAQNWHVIFPDLRESTIRNRVVEETICRLISTNPAYAHELYVSSEHNHIELTSSTITALGRAVSVVDWESAVVYLTDSRLGLVQRQQILKSLLNSITDFAITQRLRGQLAIIGETIFSVYAQSSPSVKLRRPIKAILLAMMRSSSANGRRAIQIVEAIHSTSACYFSSGFITQGLRQLLSRSFFRLSLGLLQFAANIYADRIPGWRRLLILACVRGKAHAIARRTAKMYSSPAFRRSSVEFIMKIADFNVNYPTIVLALKTLRKVRDNRIEGAQELALAIDLLVRAGRILAAKLLYASTRHHLDDAARTVMGNSILHASLSSSRRRNLQRMKKVSGTLQSLREDYGFVPDRVSVNIFLKGMLMWEKEIDSERLRGLFYYLLSNGYPGGISDSQGSITRPFETMEQIVPFGVPAVDASLPITFEKHVRPLYRMFIRAFHRRGDREAAWVVIGILKRLAAESEDE